MSHNRGFLQKMNIEGKEQTINKTFWFDLSPACKQIKVSVQIAEFSMFYNTSNTLFMV